MLIVCVNMEISYHKDTYTPPSNILHNNMYVHLLHYYHDLICDLIKARTFWCAQCEGQLIDLQEFLLLGCQKGGWVGGQLGGSRVVVFLSRMARPNLISSWAVATRERLRHRPESFVLTGVSVGTLLIFSLRFSFGLQVSGRHRYGVCCTEWIRCAVD